MCIYKGIFFFSYLKRRSPSTVILQFYQSNLSMPIPMEIHRGQNGIKMNEEYTLLSKQFIHHYSHLR